MHFEMQCEKVTPEKISDVNRVSLVSEMKLLSDGQGEIPDHKNDDSNSYSSVNCISVRVSFILTGNVSP